LADKPGSVVDNHSSKNRVTTAFQRPTQKQTRVALNASLFGLAPDGVYPATKCYHSRGALLPHLFTLTCKQAVYFLRHCP